MLYIKPHVFVAALIVLLFSPPRALAQEAAPAASEDSAADRRALIVAPEPIQLTAPARPVLAAPVPAAPALGPAAPAPDGQTPADPEPTPEGDALAASTAEIIEIVGRYVPGSTQAISARELERFEYNDVHQVLGSVPGVYIREEDGYGLRPNIGMRGSGSERSAKIALMEDGVLIAPAPYSAPAAYYFPLVTRMERVEVLKGPAAIQYGPNTVGGAINLISKSVPRRRGAELDVSAGQHQSGKLHASVADSSRHAAFLFEGIKLRTDGFKALDSGGSTGFDKNDLQLKVRLNNDTQRTIYHQLDFKIGYADEVSDETYLGLSDADFAAAPYRRYASSQLDRMEWKHTRMQLGHRVDLGSRLQITTTLYRNTLSRSWAKLNGFSTSSRLGEILANPTAGNNAIYYAVLTGAADATDDSEILMIGTNARDFVAQGAQVMAQAEPHFLGATHSLQVGLRLHHDQVYRHHSEDGYWMMSGQMLPTERPTIVTRDATGAVWALAAYAQDKMRIGPLTTTVGLRTELIRTMWEDHASPEHDNQGSQLVLIPGAGAVYQVLPSLGVLAGVHKGFVPAAPGPEIGIQPEESVNYEAGLRYGSRALSGELIGFFSDYSNLKGTCTVSSGCTSDQLDNEFNGGRVHVIGVEALAASELIVTRTLRVPVQASYTFNRSRFQTEFLSDNPQWGQVRAGDELPYLPAHQASLQIGVGQMRASGAAGMRWEVAMAGRLTSAMRDVAGQDELSPAEQTDAITVLDLAASYDLGRWGKAYLTVDNLLDQAHVVSRRPYGARPGKPRLVTLGYKNRF